MSPCQSTNPAIYNLARDITYGINVSQIEKLLVSIRRAPENVRFDDALKAAEHIGFTKRGGSGSHQTRARTGEPNQLNFQEITGGKAKPYQVRQLIAMMDKYESESGDD